MQQKDESELNNFIESTNTSYWTGKILEAKLYRGINW
jgi:hypothetical protein